MIRSLPVYEVYNVHVFAFKIVHDDACTIYTAEWIRP